MTIKEVRKSLGYTQIEVCRLLGIPRRTLQCWENGSRVPPDYVERLVIEKLQMIAKEGKVEENS